MRGRIECEFALIRYVPDPVKGEFANIGVVLRAGDGAAMVRFTRDWGRVRSLDAGVDVDLLEALEAEIAGRLAGEREGEKPVMDILVDSLSNCVQVTDMRGTLAESLPTEIEQLLRMYVDTTKSPAAKRTASGRTAIAGRMRREFERAGVWALMRKRVAARE